jgi:hypothetical protein
MAASTLNIDLPSIQKCQLKLIGVHSRAIDQPIPLTCI